jgi:hypothetical protein
MTDSKIEPEHIAHDGTIRKDHYGIGIQPWDIIVKLGWGPVFAAANALKYVRRYKTKNGEDDLKKGRWYFNELWRIALEDWSGSDYAINALKVYDQLMNELTIEEIALLRKNQVINLDKSNG